MIIQIANQISIFITDLFPIMMQSPSSSRAVSPATTQGSSAPPTPVSHPRTPRASPHRDPRDPREAPGAPEACRKIRRTNSMVSPSAARQLLFSSSTSSLSSTSACSSCLPDLADLGIIPDQLPLEMKASVRIHAQKLGLMRQSVSISIEALNNLSGNLSSDHLKLASDLLIEMDSYSCTMTRIWASCEWLFTKKYAQFLYEKHSTDALIAETNESSSSAVKPFQFVVAMVNDNKETPKQLMGRTIDTMRRETFELSRAVDRLKSATIEAANKWMESLSADSLHAYADRWKRYVWLWQRLVQKVHQQIHHVSVFVRM